MKRLFTLCFLFFFLTSDGLYAGITSSVSLDQSSTTGLVITAKTGSGFSAINSIGSVTFSEIDTPEGVFTTLGAEGYSKNYGTEGRPHLPVITKLIEVPHGASVKIETGDYSTEEILLDEMGTGAKLAPMQPSVSKKTLDTAGKRMFHYTLSSYGNNAFNTDPLVTFEIIGMTRGVRIGRLKIAPFRYNPVQNSVRVLNTIHFDVIFENADTADIKTSIRRKVSPAFKGALHSVEKLAETSSARKGAVTADADWPLTYVIVAHESFSGNNDLDAFVRWKRQSGFNVIDVYMGDSDDDSARNSIKNYLSNLYHNSAVAPSYVLLVGDIDKIPSWVVTDSSGVEMHVTDLYYFTYDGADDYMPDVYYGRFPADDDADLAAIVEKTLQYEKFEFSEETDSDYLADYMFIAGDDSDYALSYGNAQVRYAVSEYFPTIYEYLYIDNRSDIADAIRDNFNSGMGFINYTGHCDESGWYIDGLSYTYFDLDDANELSNENKYGFVIGNCCESNKFDEDDCIGEVFVNKPDGGAVGYIGASNETFWDEDFYWSVGKPELPLNIVNASEHTALNTAAGAFDGLFHENKVHTDWYISAGEIIYSGNLAVADAGSSAAQYYWEIYHLMGDPSLIPYLDKPEPFSTTPDPDDILIQSLTTTECEITNLETNSYVALSQDGILLDSAFSGDGNSVTLTFSPISSTDGAGMLVITKQNRRPATITVEIAPAGSKAGGASSATSGDSQGICFIDTAGDAI